MRYTREDGCRAWLTCAMLDPIRLTELLEHAAGAEELYDAFLSSGGHSLDELANPQQRKALREAADREAMHRMMVRMQEKEAGILSIRDSAYPDALRTLSDAPPLLFYRGDTACLNSRTLAVVGSRSASAESLHQTERIARELSERGITIVSGLAVGIDTAAHTGCLSGGSPTIGVMACGLDIDYPAESHALKEQIVAEGGALLSEFPLGSPALGWHFSVRNRIVSGLGRAVLMMEGRPKSGSMLTVHHALDQGREVFAYPGVPGSAWAEGAHQLIREGARYFTCAEDVLEDLDWLEERPPTRQERAALPPLTGPQQQVMQKLRQGEKSHDQLAGETGLSAADLSSALTMLQLLGLVRAMPGKNYCLA